MLNAAKRMVLACSAILLFGGAVVPVAAQLSAGDSVEATYLYPNTSTIYAGPVVITGPTSSMLGFAGFADILFSPTSITITTIRNAGINAVPFDGFRFSDLNNTLNFGNATLNVPATNYAGFDASRLYVSGGDIFVNVVGLPGLNGQQIVVSIPEPYQWTMLLAGLVLVGFIARRRRQGAAAA